MMNLIKSVVGLFAVIFSIQPLASWAAKSEKNNSQSEKKILLPGSKGEKGEGSAAERGSPICGGAGGKTSK